MTLITPEERALRTAELLQSLQDAIRDLRKNVEDLSQRIRTGQDVEFGSGSKELAAVEGLLRACQKVEASLVEQQRGQAGIAKGGYALDLQRARFEIGCRLARIRACCNQGDISD